MPRRAASQPNRRATNITLPADLLTEARGLGLDVSEACERGLKGKANSDDIARALDMLFIGF